ncbi:YqiA/YcfP family alpha/beta fold hydrolase [Salegentibacter sediminis]|uniref:YqiA/YcfP family alpha/beta fold hydrolase n=1 Tax=Salegentibacter sediminis TaxID=1930251 RepID=UPI0009C17452|nr:YqiA/YcfP family alpha/beta fold hydrolase [Salegentibacter sediminis]
MNILYLHGLESKLNEAKRVRLQKYGKVFAPNIDYYNIPNAIEWVLGKYVDTKFGAVIGSSMGGFAGYYISNRLDVPALLFNPALKARTTYQQVPELNPHASAFKQLVIGQRDPVVNPADTLNFLGEHLDRRSALYMHLRPEMEHRVPLDCFEQELKVFFKRI